MIFQKDEKLIRDYIENKDEKALEVLIKRYLIPIYNFANRRVGNSSIAEDITQEVFIKAWKNIKKFDQKKSFRAWIFKIAQNATIDFLRKRRDLLFDNMEVIEAYGDPASVATEAGSPSALASFWPVIKKFSNDCQEIFSLRYEKEFTFQEIADSLGQSVNTIKSRHKRAISKIKQFFQ
jgi:RNA polymerase sigma-70 factor, ECF subfamily